MMFTQAKFIEKCRVYSIFNRKTGLCLRSLPNIGMQEYQQSSNILWVLEQVKPKQYQITQIKTGDVLTLSETKQQLRLQKSKSKTNQLWSIQRAEVVDSIGYFWIRCAKNQQNCLHASARNSNVKVSSIDQSLRICLWELRQYKQTQNSIFTPMSILRSQLSNLVLDVPQFSTKAGTAIIQYLQTGGGNQRWIIQQFKTQKQLDSPQQFTITNYCSSLVLSSHFNRISNKVIQNPLNCSVDQRWIFVPLKDNKFLIQSVANQSYFLGVLNDKGGSYATLTQDKEKCYWIIQGYYPSL